MAVRDAKNPSRSDKSNNDRGGGRRGGDNPYRQGGGGSGLNTPGLPRGGNVTSKGGHGGSNTEKKSSDEGGEAPKSLLDRVLAEFQSAFDITKKKNEERYDEINEGYSSLSEDQKQRFEDLDAEFGGVAKQLAMLKGDIGKQITGIASGAIGIATDQGERRVSEITGRYDRAGTKLGDLSDKARQQMTEAGETERKGVLGRASEALGRLRGDYGDLADTSDVRRGEAARDIRGGFEGQQAEQRGGYRAAREDVGGLYDRGGERVRSDYDRGVAEAGERFRGGRGDVDEGYREAGERAGDIGGGLADRISGMSAQSLRDLVSSAEGRLGDLGEGYRDVGRGQEERIARSRGEAGEMIGGERERQEGEFARGREESEGRFGRGRERVREEYERGADEAGRRYAERGEEGRSLLRGLGDAARGRISRDFDTARTKRLGGIEQDMVRRGLGNTTIRSGARREAQSELDRNEQEALARLDDQLRREEAGAYERYSGAEEQARDRLIASGLGAGAQLTGAELGAQEGRESQRAARSGQLGQTAIGADLAAAQRGEAAAQQAGMAGAGQDIAGQTQISQLEQLLGREGLGRTIGALSQGAGTQLGLLGQGAGAGANVTGAGLSAQQNLANQGLAAGTGMTQGQISALQQLIGNQLGAQQQTALTGLGTQAQMAGQRSAAGEQLGLAGLGQQAAGNQALLGADRAIGGQALAAGLGQSAQNVGQQAALTGQGLGEQGAAERQLTGLEGQGAFQGAGAGYNNLSQFQNLLAQLRGNQLGSRERAGLGQTGTSQNALDFKERRTDVAPTLQDMAALALGFGAAGGGVNMGSPSFGGGGIPSPAGMGSGFGNVEDVVDLRDKGGGGGDDQGGDDQGGVDKRDPMEQIRDIVGGGENKDFDIPGGGGPGHPKPPAEQPAEPPAQPPTQGGGDGVISDPNDPRRNSGPVHDTDPPRWADTGEIIPRDIYDEINKPPAGEPPVQQPTQPPEQQPTQPPVDQPGQPPRPEGVSEDAIYTPADVEGVITGNWMQENPDGSYTVYYDDGYVGEMDADYSLKSLTGPGGATNHYDPTTGKPTEGNQPYKPPAGEQPAPEQPAPEQPAPEQPAPEQPAQPPTDERRPGESQLDYQERMRQQEMNRPSGETGGTPVVDTRTAQEILDDYTKNLPPGADRNWEIKDGRIIDKNSGVDVTDTLGETTSPPGTQRPAPPAGQPPTGQTGTGQTPAGQTPAGQTGTGQTGTGQSPFEQLTGETLGWTPNPWGEGEYAPFMENMLAGGMSPTERGMVPVGSKPNLESYTNNPAGYAEAMRRWNEQQQERRADPTGTEWEDIAVVENEGMPNTGQVPMPNGGLGNWRDIYNELTGQGGGSFDPNAPAPRPLDPPIPTPGPIDIPKPDRPRQPLEPGPYAPVPKQETNGGIEPPAPLPTYEAPQPRNIHDEVFGGQGGGMPGIVRGERYDGGGLVAGGGGGFDSTYVGRGAPGSGMMNPYSGPNGGFGTRSGETGIVSDSYVERRRREADRTGAGNQWEGWDFSKQGSGLAGLKQQAAGTPKAPNQSVVSKANPQGLNMLVQQSKRKPTRTLAQTYRPTAVGVYT